MLLLKTEELLPLLNHLPDDVWVRVPLLDIEIFKLDLSSRLVKVYDIISLSDYNKAYSVRVGPGPVVCEIPSYNHFCKTFWQSGLVKPTNWSSEIEPLLKKARESNPAFGEDLYFFGFDSNTLRHRLYSSCMVPQSGKDPKYNLVLCDIVREELNPRLGKFDHALLTKLGKMCHSFDLREVFENQNRLEDRLRLIGWIEFSTALASKNCQFLESENKNVKDKDEAIISLHEEFAEQPGRKVVLFSSDNEFILRCHNRPNLIGVRVNYSSNIESEYSIRWESLCRLLSILSIIYGRVDLHLVSSETVSIYGIWRHKHTEDWDQDHIALKLPDSLYKIEQSVKRNLKILRAVSA